jgi:hypothetical protein
VNPVSPLALWNVSTGKWLHASGDHRREIDAVADVVAKADYQGATENHLAALRTAGFLTPGNRLRSQVSENFLHLAVIPTTKLFLGSADICKVTGIPARRSENCASLPLITTLASLATEILSAVKCNEEMSALIEFFCVSVAFTVPVTVGPMPAISTICLRVDICNLACMPLFRKKTKRQTTANVDLAS